MVHYAASLPHILGELERIDLLIRLQVWRARQLYEADQHFQGLVVTEQEVDHLMAEPAGLPRWAEEGGPLTLAQVRYALEEMRGKIAQRKAASRQRGIVLRLDRLAEHFELAPFDVDALLICLAPELDLRYERLFAYLQDDVTRKRPSVDLVLNLLTATLAEKLLMRQRFLPSSPLIRQRLLRLFQDSTQQEPPLLAQYLKVDPRIANYLLDGADLDFRLEPFARIVQPAASLAQVLLPVDLRERLRLLIQKTQAGGSLVLYLQGPYGVGKQLTAEALARELGRNLLVVDGRRCWQLEGLDAAETIDLVFREALLQEAVLLWAGFDALLVDESKPDDKAGQPRAWLQRLLQALEPRRDLTFLTGDVTWEPADVLLDAPFVRVELARPAAAERLQLWTASLDGGAQALSTEELRVLAGKFRFSGGQIRDAAATARNLARGRDPEDGQMTLDDLYAASRLQSNRKLAELARKIEPHYAWDDIVLPADRLQQLREICNQVRFRVRVYDEWGFGRKLAMGKGLNALFAGPSGTGKTMAAEIVAHELGLDLYKIDLSTVVSKYIGETEKNLARIFAEAETSNAILFFDEADALFGKRSEVRDAHDRYANIEISYLLQKMEEYEGVVILATNLRKNMDDAFVRRMHFTVDFPFPDEKHRLRIWQKIWPADTPRNRDLDLAVMARNFELAGGNIRNIALAAAFLAAGDGQMVAMQHLLQATRREYQKMGKVVLDGEFAEAAPLPR